MHTPTSLPLDRLQSLLAIRDLTQDTDHAIHLMTRELRDGLSFYPATKWVQGAPIVDAAHNYELLGYPSDAIVQDGTYTHWVDGARMLRTQTTAMILQSLLDLAPRPESITLLAPGMVYRRDVRDRWHCAQPHQMDIWVLLPKEGATHARLHALVHDMTGASIPGVELDIRPTEHPYTIDGIEINARWQDQWLEVGEAGLIAPSLLDRLGIDSTKWGGLAMGLGLDRLVMVRKGLPDIRLLRDPLPSVAMQMRDLAAWKTISRQPLAARELSISCAPNQDEVELVEKVLDTLGEHASLLQTVEIKGRWPLSELPAASIAKLGARQGQENLLIKLTWQAEGHSIPRDEVNQMARDVYRALHEGAAWEYCP